MTHGSWTADDVPGQLGRTAVITGANTGLGFEAARILAQHGRARAATLPVGVAA